MSERNILVAVLIFLASLSFFVLVRVAGCNKSAKAPVVDDKPTGLPKPPPKFIIPNTYTPATPMSQNAPVVTPVEAPEVLDKMDSAMRERDKEIAKKNLVWLNEQINNASLASKTREIYRLRLIPEIGKAHEALRNGDPAAAMAFFEKASNDPKASVITKYLCLDYMVDIARKNKDSQLYFALWKKQGEIVKTEDLSTLNVDRDSKLLEVIERKERYFTASKDPSAMAAIIDKVSKGRQEVADRWREKILKEAKEVQESFDAK